VVITRFAGWVQEPEGSSSTIPLHNTINLGILSFPHLNLLAAISDSLTEISLKGISKIQDNSAYQVNVQRRFPKSFDPSGQISKLCKTEYFIDVTTGLILKTVDMTHPVRTMNQDYLHELEYGKYVTVEGIKLPSEIREKIIGQTIWELQLDSFEFNTGLSDQDFPLGQ
jgi:hypothetical protein